MYFTQYTDYALRSLMYVAAALVKKVFWNVCAAKAAACMGRQKQCPLTPGCGLNDMLNGGGEAFYGISTNTRRSCCISPKFPPSGSTARMPNSC